MAEYITNGVIINLVLHKRGQYRSLLAVTAILAACLLLVVCLAASSMLDGGSTVVLTGRVPSPPAELTNRLPSGSNFSLGYAGRVRLGRFVIVPPEVTPEAGVVSSPAPAVGAPGPIGTEHENVKNVFGPAVGELLDLSDPPPPIESFLTRPSRQTGLTDLSGVKIGTRPEVTLQSPTWPDDVWLAGDTATVEGVVTLQSTGLVYFRLTRESHALLGFGDAVKVALARSSCRPALDTAGNRISVSFRYRCSFIEGAAAAVQVGGQVRARLGKVDL